jgi:Queuosine salvage protein
MPESSFWNTPVLRSVVPVVEASRHVRTDPAEVERVAGWLAWEPLPFPDAGSPLWPGGDADRLTDFLLFINTLNFAFSDFATGVKFEAERGGRRWSDSDGLNACVLNAMESGVPVLDGDWMAGVTVGELERVFAGSIRIPMLEERAAILQAVGAVLVERYEGGWSRWLRSCAPAMYAGGDGLLERLVAEFPRFRDVSDHHGRPVEFLKLAQLALWQLHAAHRATGAFALRDLADVTAFADYIVPVALRLFRILVPSEGLARRIDGGVEIERDSDEEIELRAHSLYATALLADAVNRRRPPETRIVIPQLDWRLWSTYHATTYPHHLTRTIMY